jgi:hypothetical protein
LLISFVALLKCWSWWSGAVFGDEWEEHSKAENKVDADVEESVIVLLLKWLSAMND